MQHLEVSGAVRPIYGSLGVKRLINHNVASSWSNKSFHIKDARPHAHQEFVH